MRRVTALLPVLALSFSLAGCQTAQQKLTKQGIGQYNAGDFAGAQATFDQILQKDQFNAQANYYAGMSAFRQDKLETAAYHFKLAWQADPSMGEVKDALTETLIRQGKKDEALDFLDRDAALTAKIRDPRPMKIVQKRRYLWQTEENMYLHKADDRARVAQIYEKLNDFDNAALNYNAALELAPRDPDLLTAAGSFYARIGQREKAADLFTKAYNIDDKTPGLAEAIAKYNMAVR